jgi:hypothetical protein
MDRHPLVRQAPGTVFLAALALNIGSAQAKGPRRPPPSPFELATIAVERNDTDGDTEIVITAKGGDEGLKYLAIVTPDGRKVVALSSVDPTVMGLREFAFESPEPAGSQILAAYPQGTYTFIGESVIGERFVGHRRLSHQLPPAVVILNPEQDAEIGTDALTLEWSPVPGVREYIVEFENESADPQQVLRVNVPASQTRFPVPATMLVRGSEFQVGVGSVAPNGNVVFSEITFSTAD